MQKPLETMKSMNASSLKHVIAERETPKPSKEARALPDLRNILIDYGLYGQYIEWGRNYSTWRRGGMSGAKGELASSFSQSLAWRVDYHNWRRGALKGARGEASGTKSLRSSISHDASVFYDVIADEHGQPMLIPTDGPVVKGLRIDEFPPEALVTVRAFRFFENRTDETEVWEQKLRNLNSGSLLWLPVHLTPGMHSVSGAKYGKWFTVHYLQVKAKHFKSGYHMCNEGWSPAKSFGSAVEKSVITGQLLKEGYFWFVSPAEATTTVSQREQLESWGWKHLAREGPFDGDRFVDEWRKHGSSMTTHDLQVILDKVRGAQ
jgi:hypothetical protein